VIGRTDHGIIRVPVRDPEHVPVIRILRVRVVLRDHDLVTLQAGVRDYVPVQPDLPVPGSSLHYRDGMGFTLRLRVRAGRGRGGNGIPDGNVLRPGLSRVAAGIGGSQRNVIFAGRRVGMDRVLCRFRCPVAKFP
jgi:hypothetical protein